jgi:hypothetical protein
LGIAAALLAITYSGTDHAADDGPIAGHAICKHDGERNPIGQTQGDHSMLTVIPSRVVELDVRASKHLHGECKVEAPSLEVVVALGRIPVERHRGKLHAYIQSVKPRAALCRAVAGHADGGACPAEEVGGVRGRREVAELGDGHCECSAGGRASGRRDWIGSGPERVDDLGQRLAIEHDALNEFSRARDRRGGEPTRMLDCEDREGEAVAAAPGLSARVVEGEVLTKAHLA